MDDGCKPHPQKGHHKHPWLGGKFQCTCGSIALSTRIPVVDVVVDDDV